MAYLFFALTFVSCGTAAVLGGKEGRWVAFLYLTAVFATLGTYWIDPQWNRLQVPVFTIDLALMVGLLSVALNSRRYWPIWVAGFHLLTVASHFQAMVAGAFGYKIYFLMESVWSLPKLLCLLIGVLLDWESERERAGRSQRRR